MIKKIIAGVMLLSAISLSLLSFNSLAKESKNGVVITNENFIHADSTRAFLKELAQNNNKVNVIRPVREFANTDNQDIIRMNSDTLYTRIILDVKGGATITTKEYEGFQNIQVLDINHSEIKTLMGSGTVKVDETMLSEGRHAYVLVRTGLLRNLPEEEGFKKAHKAQDAISITYKSSEPWTPPVKYDFSTLGKVKYKILSDFVEHPVKDTVKKGFGTVDSRDPASARIVVAVGWGGMSGTNAVYSSFSAKGDRRSATIDKPNLHFDKKGFFSFSMYNANGYIATMNYAINSDDMIANEDGTYTINFLASGEPVKEGEHNVVRTPRGKLWTGIIRAYYPKDKDETFVWADGWAAKLTKEFMQ